MNIYINGKNLSITLEKEKNLYEILKPIEEWCNLNEFLINKIFINETEFSNEIDDKYSSIPIEEIKNINIEALSYGEYSLDSIISIIGYIEKISETVAETLRENDINDLIDGINWLLESIPRAIFLFNMNLESYNIMHLLKMLEVKLERIGELVENKDEFIEFFKEDLKPFLKDKVLPVMNDIIKEAKINTLSNFALNVNKNNALYKIGSIIRFAPFITDTLENIVNNLQTGDDREAFIYAEKFSRSVGYIFNVFSSVAGIYNIDYRNITKNEETLREIINDFNDMMNNVLEAFSGEDYVSIADILEYEIKEKLENIIEYIPLIEDYIEKLNV